MRDEKCAGRVADTGHDGTCDNEDLQYVAGHLLAFVGLLEGSKKAALDGLEESGEFCPRHATTKMRAAKRRCEQALDAVTTALECAEQHEAPCDLCEHNRLRRSTAGEA